MLILKASVISFGGTVLVLAADSVVEVAASGSLGVPESSLFWTVIPFELRAETPEKSAASSIDNVKVRYMIKAWVENNSCAN